MKSLKPLVCASLLTVALSTSALAGNIGGLKTTSAGNIGGLKTTSAGNIGGLRTNRTGNIGGLSTGTNPDFGGSPLDVPRGRFEMVLIENLGGFLSMLFSAF